MEIAGRKLGGKERPYIVAEISGNHAGDIKNAIRLIKEAKAAGADAVKTQCYSPDSMTLDCDKIDFIVQDGLWAGQSLYELYTKACTPPEWHETLYKAAADEGITIFSSVFDVRDLDLLEKLGCPAYKIASFEIVDLPLVAEVATIGKPMIISTGLASSKEVVEAAEVIEGTEACFLHCTAGYPASVDKAGLDRIGSLQTLLDGKYLIGISDHTEDLMVPIAATAKHVAMIEKHLRLDDVVGEDYDFSLNPEDFETMVEAVKLVHAGCRYEQTVRGPLRQFRRSLYAVEDIEEGEALTIDNIRSIRPGFGLAPKFIAEVLGTAAKKSYKRGDAIK